MNEFSQDAQAWRQLDTAALERAYAPSSCIGGNYQPFIQAYAERSALARASAAPLLNLAYGPAPRQRLDLFLPTPAATAPSAREAHLAPRAATGPTGSVLAAGPPLLLFIHGGYWQELSKDESGFAALASLQQGLAFAALDYTLAPQASVAEMVAECCQALAWLQSHALELGFDATRIVLAGSSAGAHLAAMVALRTRHDRAAGVALPPPLLGTVLVSGIYALEPLVTTTINQALGLNADTARALSPAFCDLQGLPPSVVCWGEVETAEFKRQSLDFARRLQAAGSACAVFEVPQRNHFDVILDLATPGSLLGAACLGLFRGAHAPRR